LIAIQIARERRGKKRKPPYGLTDANW
jgi:hypothetical protein